MCIVFLGQQAEGCPQCSVCRQAMLCTGRQAEGLHGQHAGGCTYTRQAGGCAFLNLHVDGELLV
jgi:hypothetical protein